MTKLLVRIVLGLVVLGIAAVVALGFYIDKLVKKGVETGGPMLTKVEVKVNSVNLSILSGGGSIKDLFVGNPPGYKSASAIQVGKAKMEVVPSTLLSDKVVVRTINVESPQITFETDFKGNNLKKILANVEEVTGPGDDKEPGKKLQVDDFKITGAKMSVALTALGGRSVSVNLPDIHLQNLGQGPEGITAGDLLKKVLAQLESVSAKAAADAAGNVGSEAAAAASNAAGSLKKTIGGLLK